jgi:2-amino-4-hydroxy-6-hydroxymethyldihydropteridine diphosphokinase
VANISPILARSRLYETAPVGGPPQPDFLNAAVLIAWSASPLVLLDALHAIETKLGRVRSVPNAPRTIDLDILWIEGLILDDLRLIVPHPRLHERAFALAPLLDIVPDAVDPRTNQPLSRALPGALAEAHGGFREAT